MVISDISAVPPQAELAGHRPSQTTLYGIAAVLLALCGIFILQLQMDWSLNPSYNYGWFVPFLAAYSFWSRWTRRPDPEANPSRTPAVAGVIAGAFFLLPLRVIAKANPDWRLISWGVGVSLLVVAFSLFWLIGGVRWLRHFAFPFLFCLVAIPWPTQMEQGIVHGLMETVAKVNVDLLSLCGVAALRHGSVIELTNGMLGVEDACSGIRSLQSTFMLSLFLGEFYLLRLLQRFSLIAIGAILAFLCNIARTFFLAWVAQRDGIIAIGQWHDTAGWAVLVSCLVGLWGVCLWLEDRTAPVAPSSVARRGASFPMAVFVALVAWCAFVEGGSELWFRARAKTVPVASPWGIDWPTGENLEEIPIPKAAEDLLHYNEGRAVAWQDDAGQKWNLFYFKWLPGQTAALSVKIHRPEICLPASGFVSEGDVRSRLLRVNDVTLPTRAYLFRDGAVPLHVYYCYWDGTVFRDTQEMIEEDWSFRGRLKRVWSGRRDRGAQTLEVAVWGEPDEEKAEADLKAQLARFVKPKA
ncbi:MAG: exosortase/archaeosortase family protein [Chthoniobacterales bacterium]